VAGSRILVADDNAENRALAQAALEDDGYEVELARDGAEALAACDRLRPACVVLDVQMPGIDGIAACEAIRARPYGAEPAIVFVTAQRDTAVFDRALAAGGDDFLTKPYRPSELVVRVESALRVRRLAGERGELYAQVKHQRDDLQRLQLQKEQLVAFLVHDLKNPVGSIDLQAQRILRDAAASERARSAATAIRTETAALVRMILNLLDLSRSDEGRLAVAKEQIEVAAAVAAVVEELRGAAAAASVQLVADVPGELRMHADAGLAHRMLANLIDNAIRHAAERGTVRITATAAHGAIELRVADDGTGIPAAQQAAVFQRFESSGGAWNRGLGLSFCKVAIEAHAGAIWIEDAAPGAIVCLRFPT
jgi:two-component system, sensor histidine kinase and response regulator